MPKEVIREWYVSQEPRELPICLRNNMTAYCHHAFPLCIILADDKLQTWYYEHFIQLFSLKGFHDAGLRGLPRSPTAVNEIVISLPFSSDDMDKASQWREITVVDFIDTIQIYKDVLHIAYACDPLHRDLIDCMITHINGGSYLCVFLDEYYLPGKKAFGIYHAIQPTLIYGYDHDLKRVKVVGFDANQIFGRLTFDFDTVVRAYEQAKCKLAELTNEQRSLVDVIRPRRFEVAYPFSMSRFLTELNDYISASCHSPHFYLEAAGRFSFGVETWEAALAQGVHFGLGVYRDIDDGLNNLLRNKHVMDYKQMHLLFEHKKGLYDRLNFVASTFINQAAFQQFLADYESIVKRLQLARLKFLKYVYSGNSNILREVIDGVTTAAQDELALLPRIHEKLHDESAV